MVFSGIPFLFYFLPVTLLLYYIAPFKLKNSVLLLTSLFFYAWGEPKFLILMLITVAQSYAAGLLIERFRRFSKPIMAVSVILSFISLGYFKYADFFIGSFNSLTGLSVPLTKAVLPIGISFYTFQIASYVVDVYRSDTPAQKNPIDLAAYVTMFPQLIAGPIVRYSDVALQLRSRSISSSSLAYGARRFILGLSKKLLIADVLGELVAEFKVTDERSVLFWWIYALSCTLQIYFDFSGYSDMAIGLGKLLGFDFPENFDHPFISGSITEFWRRWHMTLGGWFRDYLYIPLGGNRVSRVRWIVNIAVVWMATGLWHGAAWNFVLWGVFFAIFLMIEKLWLLKYLKKSRVWGHIYVMFLVIISFLIFDASSISTAFNGMISLFGIGRLPLTDSLGIYLLKSNLLVFLIAVIGSTPLPAKLFAKADSTKVGGKILSVVEPIGLTILLAVCTAYMVDGSYSPFLYFRF